MENVESSNEPPPVVVQPGGREGHQTLATTVISHQISKVQGQPQNIRQWSTPLCGCCENISRCCYAYFCCPCFSCGLAGQMDECALGPCCLGCTFIGQMRTKLRTEYGIQGTVLDDCCTSLWCSLCILLQIDRELDHLGYSK